MKIAIQLLVFFYVMIAILAFFLSDLIIFQPLRPSTYRDTAKIIKLTLASHFPSKALILEAPFVSTYRVKTRFPFLPFDRYPNLSRIAKVKVPILVIHDTYDRVVPIWHGKALFAAITGEKQAFWVEGADHNNILEIAQETYWRVIDTFLKHI